MRNAKHLGATLAAALAIVGLSPAAKAGTCGDESCWKYTETSAGSAATPADVLKVLQANKRSPAVAEAVQRVALFTAAGITPAVSVQQDHWQVGTFTWTGPTACPAGDARLTTAPAFSHSYCLNNGACVPGEPVAPVEKDPCG